LLPTVRNWREEIKASLSSKEKYKIVSLASPFSPQAKLTIMTLYLDHKVNGQKNQQEDIHTYGT